MNGDRLIVAATRSELNLLLGELRDQRVLELPYGEGVRGNCWGVRITAIWLGIGKVNSAAGLALAVERLEPLAVVQTGIGGLFRPLPAGEPGSARLRVGGAAVASSEVHLDLGVRTDSRFLAIDELGFPLLKQCALTGNRVPVAYRLSRELAGDDWPMVPFGTAETVSGSPEQAEEWRQRWGVAVESMEGAAAAQVCLALGVPFAQVRGLSNLVGERDKTKWQIPEALASTFSVLATWLQRGAPVPEP